MSRGEPIPPTAIHGPDPLPPVSNAVAAPEEPNLRGVDKLTGEYLASVASSDDKGYIEKTGGFDLRGIAVR